MLFATHVLLLLFEVTVEVASRLTSKSNNNVEHDFSFKCRFCTGLILIMP